MWHLRNVRRGRWEIFNGRQYHSPYFTWALLVASTFTKEYLPVNSFNIRILQTHIAISLLVIFAVWKTIFFLIILITYNSISLDNICVSKKGYLLFVNSLLDISIFPDKWIMAASWANNEPLCRSSNFWNFNLLCILSTIYDTAKKIIAFLHRLSIITCTVVEESYLKDFVCPFSKNTFRTFGIRAMTCACSI